MNETTVRPLLTVKEAADLLGVNRHTVYNLIKADKIPVVKLSPQVWRIPRAMLIQRLEELAATARADAASKEYQ